MMGTPIYGDVKQWDAEPLRTAAEDVKKDADALEEIRDEVESIVPWSWLGPASSRAAIPRDRLVRRMNTHLEGRRQVQKALEQAADQVAEVKRLVPEVEAEAKRNGGTIDYHGNLIFLVTLPPDDTPEREEIVPATRHSNPLDPAMAAILAGITNILSLAAAADATITNSIPADHVPAVDEYGTVDPEVARHWAMLFDSERQAIIRQLVRELAKENGIDPNTITMQLVRELAKENGIDPNTIDPDLLLDPDLLFDLLGPDRLHDADVLGYVANEVRRARQVEAARDVDASTWFWEDDPFEKHEEDGITRKQAEEWKKDFEDDNRFHEDPSEVDARAAERKYVEDELTQDELLRLLVEGQRWEESQRA